MQGGYYQDQAYAGGYGGPGPSQPPPPSHSYSYRNSGPWDQPPQDPRYHQEAAYASRGYAPPPPPLPQLQYSPPDEFRAPDNVGTDVNAFARFFSHHLGTLSFNSKPVITNLTLFAHQHLLRMSSIVASCLDDHLRLCPPQTKLPALYLLDSISKNIGPPYIVLFSRFIERRFLEAYQVVDSPTKIKMEELLGTWRTGGSDGGELFRLPDEGRGGRVQRGIETALFGAGGRGGGIGGGGRALRENESYQSGMQQLPAPATQGERSGVLFDVRRLLQLRHDQALANPEDAVNSSQIVALQKLESLVLGTQLTSDQVYQIRGQLAILAPREPEPEVLPSLTAAVSSVPYDDSATGAPASSSAAHALDNPTPYLPPTPPTPSLPLASHQGIDLNLLAQLQGPGKLAELLAMTAPPVAPVAPSSIFQQQPPAQTPAAPLLPQADKLTKEYEDAIVQLNVHLNNADILKSRPEALSFLYGRFGLQCKQCGLRFFDSRSGKKQMDAHLDWHFTHKRRIREGAGRAQGRSWLSLEEDWLLSDTVDVAYDNAEGSSSTVKADPSVVDRAQLLQRKVIAPTDPAMLAIPCPVCKERFKSEWSEEDEDWVFKNAVDMDGTIYHATCHAEAAAAKLGRLRLDESNRPSRESTPKGGGGERVGENGFSDSKKRKGEWDDLGGSAEDFKRPKSEQPE